jgi:hypothetical protein
VKEKEEEELGTPLAINIYGKEVGAFLAINNAKRSKDFF